MYYLTGIESNRYRKVWNALEPLIPPVTPASGLFVLPVPVGPSGFLSDPVLPVLIL
jgi:hypothetical protein